MTASNYNDALFRADRDTRKDTALSGKAPARLSAHRAGKTVMVIDDDENLTDLVTLYLGHLGFHSLIVHSGMTGLAKASKLRPDCILLDLSMPEVDGFTFLRARQKMPEVMAIPVVVLSANNMLDDVKRAIELGAVGYVIKPIDLDKLADRLDRVLPSPYFSPADTSEVSWKPGRG